MHVVQYLSWSESQFIIFILYSSYICSISKYVPNIINEHFGFLMLSRPGVTIETTFPEGIQDGMSRSRRRYKSKPEVAFPQKFVVCKKSCKKKLLKYKPCSFYIFRNLRFIVLFKLSSQSHPPFCIHLYCRDQNHCPGTQG